MMMLEALILSFQDRGRLILMSWSKITERIEEEECLDGLNLKYAVLVSYFFI